MSDTSLMPVTVQGDGWFDKTIDFFTGEKPPANMVGKTMTPSQVDMEPVDTSSQAVSDWESYYPGIYSTMGGGKLDGATEDYSDAHAAGVSTPAAPATRDDGPPVGFLVAFLIVGVFALFGGRS